MTTGKYLHILSLDGGGYRGVIELYILQKIMESVKTQLGLPEVPRPCEYFDLIVGTSTGGLIALLLGRLGWTVAQALESYETLGMSLFSHQAHDLTRFLWDGTPRFDSKPLKQWVDSNVPADDNKMIPSNAQGKCRVAITTVLQNIPSARPIMLRSYKDTKGAAPPTGPHSWSIAEAALATSAAPSYFPPLQITAQSGTISFQDAGAAGFNNPVAAAVAEAGWVHSWSDSDKPIAVLVSLGTGLMPGDGDPLEPPVHVLPEAGVGPIVGAPRPGIPEGWFPKPGHDAYLLMQYLISIASDSQRAHNEQASQWWRAYFRLNPPDLGHYDLSDVSQETKDALKDGTGKYLATQGVVTQIDQVAQRLNPNWTPPALK